MKFFVSDAHAGWPKDEATARNAVRNSLLMRKEHDRTQTPTARNTGCGLFGERVERLGFSLLHNGLLVAKLGFQGCGSRCVLRINCPHIGAVDRVERLE